MKIKEVKRNQLCFPNKPITIHELSLEIRKLLNENLALTYREAGIESRFILEHALKVKHKYLIQHYGKYIDEDNFKEAALSGLNKSKKFYLQTAAKLYYYQYYKKKSLQKMPIYLLWD